MQVPIKDIIVHKRVRRDMGDIDALADSMKRLGQITPIMISRKNVLIAGGRRLEAAKLLGWRAINAVVADVPDRIAKLEFEIEENLHRQDFSPEELARATRELYRRKHPGFFRRIWNAVVRFFARLFHIDEF